MLSLLSLETSSSRVLGFIDETPEVCPFSFCLGFVRHILVKFVQVRACLEDGKHFLVSVGERSALVCP